MNYNDINLKSIEFEDMRYDEVSRRRIKLLKKQLESAITMEDFDIAKEIKKKIANVNLIAERIYALECNKKVCIVNQDYETSKTIKLEIEKLKMNIISMSKLDRLNNLNNNLLNNSINNKSIELEDEAKIYRDKITGNEGIDL